MAAKAAPSGAAAGSSLEAAFMRPPAFTRSLRTVIRSSGRGFRSDGSIRPDSILRTGQVQTHDTCGCQLAGTAGRDRRQRHSARLAGLRDGAQACDEAFREYQAPGCGPVQNRCGHLRGEHVRKTGRPADSNPKRRPFRGRPFLNRRAHHRRQPHELCVRERRASDRRCRCAARKYL